MTQNSKPNNNNFIDLGVRNIISVAYRIILVLTSVILLYKYDDKIQIKHYYLILIILTYTIGYTFLFRKSGPYSIIRLFLDFALIAFILTCTGTQTVLTFFLLALPILNSNNHTSNKRTIFVYILPFAILFALNDFNPGFGQWFPLLIITLIGLFDFFRYKVNELNQSMSRIVNDYLNQQIELHGTYMLLDNIKSRINEGSSKFLFTIENILCFSKIITGRSKTSSQPIENDYILYNSSQFIWQYKISNEFIQKPIDSQPGIAKYIPNITYNSIRRKISFALPLEKEDGRKYIFIFILQDRKITKYSKFIIKAYIRSISGVFSRLLVAINIEQELQKLRENNVNKIKDKLIYVKQTNMAMHYVRNKLTPLKNFIEMDESFHSNKYKKLIKPSFFKDFEHLLDVERKKSQVALNDIVIKASQILNKENNPFLILDKQPQDIRDIFNTVRIIWKDSLPLAEISQEWSSQDKITKIPNNQESFEILITDIVSNICKYSKSYSKIHFGLNESELYIKFTNDLYLEQLPSDFNRLLNEFNDTQTSEIFSRQSHGLSLIKNFLTQLGWRKTLVLNADILVLTIYLKS